MDNVLLNCNELQHCSTHNWNKCYFNSTENLVGTFSLLQTQEKLTTISFLTPNNLVIHHSPQLFFFSNYIRFVCNKVTFVVLVCAGFITSKVACCGQGPYNGLGLCTPLSNLCPNRDQYAFWDAFHPSEKANKLIVEEIMSGSKAYMNPMNLSTILALDPITTWRQANMIIVTLFLALDVSSWHLAFYLF